MVFAAHAQTPKKLLDNVSRRALSENARAKIAVRVIRRRGKFGKGRGVISSMSLQRSISPGKVLFAVAPGKSGLLEKQRFWGSQASL